MRSKNYADQAASFTPLEPQQMVRVALVEGMKPKYEDRERQRYRRLLKDYLDITEEGIGTLFRLMETGAKTQDGKNTLGRLISLVAYDGEYWKNFDYEHLKKEGVIIPHNGNLKGLVGLIQEIDKSKVIFTPSVVERALAPEDEHDYLKHIDWRNKLVLNGKDVVEMFARDKGIELPENYLRNGYMTTNVFNLLQQNGFYFNEALRSAIKILKEPKYQNRIITSMAIKRADGTELRFHPHDWVEAAEFYMYCFAHKRNLIETLGKKITDPNDKRYYGADAFLVPKRTPVNGQQYNYVEMHFFPDPHGKGKYPLSWMGTKVACNCPHALNMRNFEDRKGKQMRVVETMDTHANMFFLKWIHLHKKEIDDLGKVVNNMSPVPTLELSDVTDKIRYNLAQEFEVEEKGKPKINRTYVGEVGIEALILELAKTPSWTFERMFNPDEKVGGQLLKPMYI